MAETSKATQFCADGTPFPVEWLFPGDEAMPWVRDDYHFPLLMPPLEVGLQRLTLATRSAAFREVTGADAPPFWHHFLFPQGFMFIPGDIGPRAQVPPEILAFLLKEWGGARGFFVGYCLPRIRELCHGLQGEEAIWPIERLAAAWMEAFSLTQVALAATVGTIMVALRQFLEESFGVEAQRLREELLQGQENSMQASDQALFELARLASRV